VALLIMVVTATLLLCDAWFDITLSWGGSEGWTSLLTAIGCEVPLALAMLARARSVIVQTATVVAPQDPRISLTVLDAGNPYHSAEIRGTAERAEDPAKTLPRTLSRKYLGEDPPPEPADVLRLIVRVRPQKISAFSA
jgi:hypothetical protein